MPRRPRQRRLRLDRAARADRRAARAARPALRPAPAGPRGRREHQAAAQDRALRRHALPRDAHPRLRRERRARGGRRRRRDRLGDGVPLRARGDHRPARPARLDVRVAPPAREDPRDARARPLVGAARRRRQGGRRLPGGRRRGERGHRGDRDQRLLPAPADRHRAHLPAQARSHRDEAHGRAARRAAAGAVGPAAAVRAPRDPRVHPRRRGQPVTGARPGAELRRAPLVDPAGGPGPALRVRERGHAQDLRLGGHRRGADHDRRDRGNELHPHAGALDHVGLPGDPRDDGHDLRHPLPRLQAERLAVTRAPGWGAITDVPGVRVGHATRVGGGWLTGVTVVLPPPGTGGGVDVRGGGPGTHETDALDPTTLVPTVDAVVLTGGSAYGLAAAGGVQAWCEERGRGFPVGPPDDPRRVVVPIVPAAAVFDLGRGGDPRARPDAALGRAAVEAAADGGAGDGRDETVPARGCVGAGTGALVARGALKGGVGTASLPVQVDVQGYAPGLPGLVVGALAVVNAFGSPVDPVTGALLGTAFVPQGLVRPPAPSPAAAASLRELLAGGTRAPAANTTLAVVVTNAPPDPAQCRRAAPGAPPGPPPP